MSDSVWSHRRQPPGSPIPGILQARTLEWVAIFFSNTWKWKGKVKSLSRVRLLATPWTAAHQAPPSLGFSRQEYWSGVPLPSPDYHTTKSKYLWPELRNFYFRRYSKVLFFFFLSLLLFMRWNFIIIHFLNVYWNIVYLQCRISFTITLKYRNLKCI